MLDSPEKCLILNPDDWREMLDLKTNTVLLCISNQYYDPDDYVTVPYADIFRNSKSKTEMKLDKIS